MQITNQNTNYTDLMQAGSFVGSTLIATGIKNALVIFHGICGCNIEAIHFRSDQIPNGQYVPIIPTGLNETDCINGGIPKLLSTLRDNIKKKHPPSVVFILTSDSSSITGDDIYSAAQIVEKETNIPIIAVDSAGFTGNIATGTDVILNAIIKKFQNTIEISKHKSGLNIIAPHLIGSKNWTNDLEEITRLLKESEVPVNLTLCRNFDIDSIKDIAKAKNNYILSAETLTDFEIDSNNLGIKTLKENVPLPIGVANTQEWLTTLVKAYGNITKAKVVLEKDQKLVTKQLKFNYNFSWMTTLMYGKYASIYGHAKFSASLARCLYWDFGIIPKVIALIAETDRAMQESIELLKPLEETTDFVVLKNPTYFEYINEIKKAKVDFAIGSIQDKPLCLGEKIPHLSLSGFYFFNQYNFIPWPYFGIRGVLGLLSELSKIMEDTFYMKDMLAEYNYKEKQNESCNS